MSNRPAPSLELTNASTASGPSLAGVAVRAAVYLGKTVARFLRASRAAVVAFFGPLEIETIERDGARLCTCAEGVHAKDESCAMEGGFI